jgi:hypothetical protein
MEVEHALKRSFPVGLEKRQAWRLERLANRSCDFGSAAEHSSCLHIVQLEEVFRMSLHGNQNVAGIHLPDVHEGERLVILMHHGRRNLLGDDLAENATRIVHSSAPGD